MRLRLLQRVALAGLIVFFPGIVEAQQIGPPIPLVPPPETPSSPAAPPIAPGSKPVPLTPPSLIGEPLAPLAPGWSGDTAPRGEALPHDFWSTTPRALADMLLARLPDTTSPALQSLLRRLLLSAAAAPNGPDPEAPAESSAGGLPALRAAALLRLGEIEAAQSVIGAMPDKERAAALQLAVAADAIAGHIGDACAKVGEMIHRDQRAFWQRALIACQTLQGDTDKASLGLQLLAEEKERDDALRAAVDALAGRSAPAVIERLDHPDPLLLHALVAAKRRLAPALVGKLRADLALTLALDDKAPAELRLAAAERAAECGALGVDRLRDLYSNLADPDAKANASPVMERAQRFVAIAAAGNPADRLARTLAFAAEFPDRDGGGLFLAARLVAPNLHDIPPDASSAEAMRGAARLLLAAGDFDGARRWLAGGSGDPELRQILALTAASDRAAAARSAPLGPPLDDAAATRRLWLTSVRMALDLPIAPAEWSTIPPSAWTALGPPAPPLAAWLDLADAAHGKRIGEAVLAAVLVAAPQGTLTKDAAAAVAAIGALRQIGLEADARHLAVEAALGR